MMVGVYRIPLRRVFNKKQVKGDATWNDVYGHHKCLKCKQHFGEGDAYTVIRVWKANKDGSGYPVHKYQHVECQK